MIKISLKLITILIFLGIIRIGTTNAYFVDSETSIGNTMTAGCWSGPAIPELIFPSNGYIAKVNSTWSLNPYMDWADSWACPNKQISYQYESYYDSNLNNLAYRSNMLSNSRIPAGGTADGSYYWRVRAFDGDNWSGWSTVWLLIVDNRPMSFVIASPPVFVQEETFVLPSPTPELTIILTPTIVPEVTPTPSYTLDPIPVEIIEPVIIPTPSLVPELEEVSTPVDNEEINFDGGTIIE